MHYINRLFTYLLTYLLTYLAMMHEGTILLCVTSHHFRGVLHEYMSNNRHFAHVHIDWK